MFLLQLQLYVLTIIRVTLRRIQKPFRRKSTFCKFKYTILSILRVQRKSVLQALYSDCSEWAMHWSIVLARVDLVSPYFGLLWYHSVLRGSLVTDGLHDFQIFPDRTVREWSVGAGNICSVSVFLIRGVGSQISPRRAKKDPNIPSPGRTRSVLALPLASGQQRQSNPHPMPCLPPPPRHDIDRCIILMKLFLCLNGKTS